MGQGHLALHSLETRQQEAMLFNSLAGVEILQRVCVSVCVQCVYSYFLDNLADTELKMYGFEKFG